MNLFPERIKLIRGHMGLTQKQMAQLLSYRAGLPVLRSWRQRALFRNLYGHS